MRKFIQRLGAAMALGLLCVSCGTNQLYDWGKYDGRVYDYTANPTEENQAQLEKELAKLTQETGGIRKLPPPGVCADYGYLLIKRGKVEEGKKMLMLEVTHYPESSVLINQVIKRISNN